MWVIMRKWLNQTYNVTIKEITTLIFVCWYSDPMSLAYYEEAIMINKSNNECVYRIWLNLKIYLYYKPINIRNVQCGLPCNLQLSLKIKVTLIKWQLYSWKGCKILYRLFYWLIIRRGYRMITGIYFDVMDCSFIAKHSLGQYTTANYHQFCLYHIQLKEQVQDFFITAKHRE